MNQKGMSSMVILFIVVLSLIIVWELNNYIKFYNQRGDEAITALNNPSSSPGSASSFEQDAFSWNDDGRDGSGTFESDAFSWTDDGRP